MELEDKKTDVLDHGYARLVDYMGDDLAIVRSARVSFDAEWRTGEEAGKDEKLIGYLYRNRHTSPFEAVHFTFEIKCPIFIARQWMRHRTWSYNEVSARYAELPDEFYVPAPGVIGAQSNDNKQARKLVGLDVLRAEKVRNSMQNNGQAAFEVYRTLIADGVPRELARSVLPVSTYTRFFASVDLHNLFHFLRLRLHEHAQYEIRVYADAMLELIRPIVPIAVAEFERSLET